MAISAGKWECWLCRFRKPCFLSAIFPSQAIVNKFAGLISNGGVTGVQRSTLSVPLRPPASSQEPLGERTGMRFFLNISSEPLDSTHRPMQGVTESGVCVSCLVVSDALGPHRL